MAYRVELTRRALRDLQRVYTAIDAQNSTAAADWFNTLEQAILGLDTRPRRHPVTPESEHRRHLLHSSRSYVYRVIFRIDDERQIITVLHIRHGSRRHF